MRTILAVTLTLLLPGPVLADLPQETGWPRAMGTYQSGQYVLAPRDGVALADLDGDKKLDIVASSGGKVYAWSAAGKALAGWPVTVQGTAQAPPAVGDVDGDGDLEVVQVCRSLKYSETSWVNVIHHDGKAAKGWPVSFSTMVFLPVNLADLNGDGALDLLVQVSKWPPGGTIKVLGGDGKPMGQWDRDLGELPIAPPSVGDVNGDGLLEVLHTTRKRIILRKGTGPDYFGGLVTFQPGKASRFAGGALLLDLHPTGPGTDIVSVVTDDGSKGEAKVLVHAAAAKAGSLLSTITLASSGAAGVLGPVSGDVDGDGDRELVVGLRGLGFYVVDRSGKVVHGPIKPLKDPQTAPVLVDLDGDGDLELLCDNNSTEQGTGNGYLEAYHADGKAVAGFPLRPKGSTMVNNAAVADVDGDGKLELALVTTNLTKPFEAWVNLYELPKAKAAKGAWPMYGNDSRRSFCAGCPAASSKKWPPDLGVPDLGAPDMGAPDSGADAAAPAPDGSGDSGCALAGRGAGGAWLLSLLLIGGAARRRRQ